MARNSLSVQKRMRQNLKRRVANKALKNEIKTVYKRILDLVEKKAKKEATELLKRYNSLLDKARKKNVFHINNTSRKKSVAEILVDSIDNVKKETKVENA